MLSAFGLFSILGVERPQLYPVVLSAIKASAIFKYSADVRLPPAKAGGSVDGVLYLALLPGPNHQGQSIKLHRCVGKI